MSTAESTEQVAVFGAHPAEHSVKSIYVLWKAYLQPCCDVLYFSGFPQQMLICHWFGAHLLLVRTERERPSSVIR